MIYCVEDDDDIRELMLYTLRTTGFEAQGFPNSELFWQAMEQVKPDLIFIDIMLPGSDGLSSLEELRAKKAVKVFLLSWQLPKEQNLTRLRAWIWEPMIIWSNPLA